MMVTKGNVSTCPRTPRRVPQALHQQRNCFYRAGPARPGPTAPTFEPFTTTNTTPPPTEQPQENGKGRRRCRAAPLECFVRVRAPTKCRARRRRRRYRGVERGLVSNIEAGLAYHQHCRRCRCRCLPAAVLRPPRAGVGWRWRRRTDSRPARRVRPPVQWACASGIACVTVRGSTEDLDKEPRCTGPGTRVVAGQHGGAIRGNWRGDPAVAEGKSIQVQVSSSDLCGSVHQRRSRAAHRDRPGILQA